MRMRSESILLNRSLDKGPGNAQKGRWVFAFAITEVSTGIRKGVTVCVEAEVSSCQVRRSPTSPVLRGATAETDLQFTDRANFCPDSVTHLYTNGLYVGDLSS